jgi:HSP20 family protein
LIERRRFEEMAIIRRQHDPERALSRTGLDPLELMRGFMQWDPFRELSPGMLGTETAGFVPSFEVKETKDSYVFKTDLPGLKESDVDISVTGNRLTISGQRQEEKRDEGDTFYALERSYGTFSRSFTLPEGIDVDHINAELKDGVLNVVIPKKPEVQPKRVQLKGATEGENKAKA